MKILGIDTATKIGSLAIVDSDGLLGEYTLTMSTTNSRRLLPALDQLFTIVGLDISRIDALAISLGPGSFTGLRIAASTVKGLALAANKPVVGIPTLDALAYSLRGFESLICPMLDARKKEVYTALYRSKPDGELQKETADLAVAPEAFLRNIDENVVFLGDGSILYRPLIQQIVGSKATFASPHMHHPRAAATGFLALEKAAAEDFLDVSAFTPIYARPSEAERNMNITNEVCKNRDLVPSK